MACGAEKGLTVYADALAKVRERARALPALETETIELARCLGRVAAGELRAEETLPAWPSTSMDGFAVRASDVASASRENPVRLKRAGVTAAGDARASGAGGAWEIMTGAPLPEGYDAVVRVEDTRVAGDGSVEILAEVAPGEHLREAGEDFRAGSRVLTGGERLGSQHVLALSALGVSRVEVRRRPRVAIVATGKEIAEGTVRNSSTPLLLAELAAFGADARSYGTAGDDPREFARAIERALADGPDVVVSTGAVSMGRHDYVTGAFGDLGGRADFHKVAMRPGKPLLFGAFERGPVFFGMPGNPVSTFVAARFFLEPFLRERLGMPAERPIRARLAKETKKPEGLRCFFKALHDGGTVSILPGQASFLLHPLLMANGWAVLPEVSGWLPGSIEVDFYPLSGGGPDVA